MLTLTREEPQEQEDEHNVEVDDQQFEEDAAYATEEEPEDSGEESEITYRPSLQKDGHGVQRKENHERRSPTHTGAESRGLGIGGLMKAFIGKPVFSGAYEEDLDNIYSMFDALSEICPVSPE